MIVPSDSQYLPAVHKRHVVDPFMLLNMPTGQSVDEEMLQYDPEAHSWHELIEVARRAVEYRPVAHDMALDVLHQ